jgi:hypothetical protein
MDKNHKKYCSQKSFGFSFGKKNSGIKKQIKDTKIFGDIEEKIKV